jgi:AraC-like DNA-binding protein
MCLIFLLFNIGGRIPMTKYQPKGHSSGKTETKVHFREAEPPGHLSEIVHRYLELRTDGPLKQDYRFHALPDACTYVVFNQQNTKVAGVTKLRTSAEEFNLGRSFHFVNIRFFPGVLQTDDDQVSYGPIDAHYSGPLPLVDVNNRLVGLDFDAKQEVLTELVEDMVARKLLMPNSLVQRILSKLDEINSVQDMAVQSLVSSRQLQRILRETTGLAPHDFLKVLRLQKALSGDETDRYADQSHFIRSFRSATGYTPGRYAKEYGNV